MAAISIIFIGLMVFVAHLFAQFYKQKMVPDVLLLIIIGILIGPVLQIISPDQLGVVGKVFPTLTLAVILFESGISLNFTTLKRAWKPTMKLSLLCYFITSVVITVLGLFLLKLDFGLACTFGFTLGGVSSAVAIPLLKQVPVGEETVTVLILEAAITSVLCIVIPLACLEGIVSQSDSTVATQIGMLVGKVLSSFIIAAVIGMFAAMIWSRLLEKIRGLQNSIFTTPAFLFVIYGISEYLGFSGAISALAFGIILNNIHSFKGFFAEKVIGTDRHSLNQTEIVFVQEISFLLKTFFFVYVGMSMVFDNWLHILFGLGITVAIFLIRTPVAKLCSPLSATPADKSFIALMVPKGLAAAVMAAIPVQ
ncbi:MAG: cation:proton antiporter, partial [Bacteroidales bacterium]|nr:cation:proton antiporter [Bacteroidales bacterium]